MPESPRKDKERAEVVWLEKLHAAEQRCRNATALVRSIQADLESIPASDGDFALEKALKLQNEALDEYARVLRTFTRLVIKGEPPDQI